MASDEFAYASIDQVEELARALELGERFEVPAERVTELPLRAGSRAEMHRNGKLRRGGLARDHVVSGVPCAAGPIELGWHGGLERATLARPHTFCDVELPANTVMKFWEQRAGTAVVPV